MKKVYIFLNTYFTILSTPIFKNAARYCIKSTQNSRKKAFEGAYF